MDISFKMTDNYPIEIIGLADYSKQTNFTNIDTPIHLLTNPFVHVLYIIA